MAKVIKSPSFSGGVASYNPIDVDELWVSNHANLAAWVSGSSLSLREVDNIWDDAVKPDLVYYPGDAGALMASPSAAIGGRPSIRCPGRGLRNPGLVVPANYTAFITAQVDAITGATQVLIGGATNPYPRFSLQVGGTGNLTLAHNSSGSAVGTPGAVTPGAFLAAADYNTTTNLARIYLNNVASAGQSTFAVDHPTTAGFGVGQMGDNGSPMTGDIGDVLVFNAVLSDADRARVMRYLSRKSGIVVGGV